MPQPQHGQIDHCKTCRAKMVWGLTEKGKVIPLDWQEKTVFRYVVPKSAHTIEPIDEEEPIKLFFLYKDRMLLRDTYELPPKAYTFTGEEVIPQQVQAWQTHFATCPDSALHKRNK